MQIHITKNGELAEIIAVIPPSQARPSATYTDPNNNRMAVFTADIPDQGPGITITTEHAGCLLPAASAEPFVRELHAAGRDAAGTEDTGPVDIGQAEPGPYSPLTGWDYVDVDQDVVRVKPATLPDGGPAVHVITSPAGCSIPLADVPGFGVQVLTVAAAATELGR